jgi:hypothetical protein
MDGAKVPMAFGAFCTRDLCGVKVQRQALSSMEWHQTGVDSHNGKASSKG